MSELTLAELRALPDDELVEAHDFHVTHASAGWTLCRDELERWQRAQHDARIADLTTRIYWLTVTITLTTIANLLIFAVSRSG